MLMTMILIALVLQSAEVRIDGVFSEDPNGWVVIILIAFFLIFCLQPFMACGYRTARY